MTDEEWRSLDDPLRLDYDVLRHIPDRKFWLFGAACCRTVWHLLDDVGRRATQVADRMADGEARYEECFQAHRTIQDLIVAGKTGANSVVAWALDLGYVACQKVSMCPYNASQATGTPLSFYANLLRCIVGNPFRKTPFEPHLTTSTVGQLATGIYEDRAFYHLPILADALEDAGCDSDGVLSHLREPGPHDRGCWVVDLILGKHESRPHISRSPPKGQERC